MFSVIGHACRKRFLTRKDEQNANTFSVSHAYSQKIFISIAINFLKGFKYFTMMMEWSVTLMDIKLKQNRNQAGNT